MENSLRVSKIFIYPIKSLGGIQLESGRAMTAGFEHDRRMMLVDPNGKFISQREYCQMALFRMTMTPDNYEVNYKGNSLNISKELINDEHIPVTIFDNKLKAHTLSTEIDEWFSDALSTKVRLVKMGNKSTRQKVFLKPPYRSYVSLADGYPYLMIGSKSLDNLNSKCVDDFPMDRFRGNIIVESSIAHEEDQLEDVTIGSASFKNIKPCARCVMVTVDQQTSAKGKEPLATLATYRKEGNKVYFGTNLICMKEGVVSVGDKVQL